MANQHSATFLFVIVFTIFLTWNLTLAKERKEKLFPVFQIVNFANEPCGGSNSRNGTCYTSEECENKGGTSSGSCANGYGVCCTFTNTCGDKTSQNCTYFTNPSTTSAGECKLEVCPMNDNICQLRLDFNRFTITGPSTISTTNIAEVIMNDIILNPAPTAHRDVANKGQCLTDIFSVTGGSAPNICGMNSGQHMYVDANSGCNDLVFQLGSDGIQATIPTREWEIKVSQIECNSILLPPKGCTQYFYGDPDNHSIQSYNFAAGTTHLSDQEQKICIRREKGNCRICYFTAANADFALSEGVAGGGAIANSDNCCNWGLNGADMLGYDCLRIPGAIVGVNLQPINHCGRNNGIAGGTVCSTSVPFSLTFDSDSYENPAELPAGVNKGFQIKYTQSSQNC